ncbi:hypothetical protein K438DRAFT_1951119 [Mycena galopus ATCC 62051]|nr:hypothetical protein K438DRAFT_1951119 [Mycena galopus ATCC 62051]
MAGVEVLGMAPASIMISQLRPCTWFSTIVPSLKNLPWAAGNPQCNAPVFCQDSHEQHIYVLYGLGGAGKTQIALRFIKESGCFTDKFLVDASSTETIETGLKAIATAKEIGNSLQDALKWLASRDQQWLLFFDNVDDPKLNLNKFFPKCNHGNIIITSRNPNLRVCGAHSQVSDMEEADAVTLLLKSAAPETSLPNELLAAEIVKHYIQKIEQRLLRDKPTLSHDDYACTVYTTWQMSFDRLSPPAAMFLQLCSFLHREGISEDIFSRAAYLLIHDQYEHKPKRLQKLKAKFRRLWSRSEISPKNNAENPRKFLSLFLGPNGEWDSVSFMNVTKEIMAYSLINFDAERKSFSIHPLVHEWTRTTVTDKDSVHECMAEILGMCIKQIPREDIQLTSLRLVSYVDSLMPTEISRFGREYAMIYYHVGRYISARELEAVLQEWQKILGDDHVDTLHAMNNLANTYCNLGQFQDAEKLQLVVLEKWRKLVGNDLNILLAMNNLANTYGDLGQHEEAEKLQLVVLEKRRNHLGDDHLDTLKAMNNLAVTYDKLGRFAEAEKLKIVGLEKRRKFLGDGHPNTLAAMHTLGCAYYNLGQFEKAEELQVAAVEKQRKLFGDNHPNTPLI